MRIGFDAKRAFLNTSGLGNYSRNTLNALYEYFPDNEYVLYTPEVKFEKLLHQDHFEIVSPPRSDSKLKKTIWRTYQLSKEVSAHNLNLFHGLSNELPKGIHQTSVPTLVTVHDLIFLRYPQFYKPIDRAIYFNKTKYACRTATKVLAISQQTKDDIVEFTGTNPDKVEILHQSISPVFFTNADTEFVADKYNLPEDFILAVGTIEERKNQLSILKAIVEKGIDIDVVFVGNPTSYCNDIHKYIADKGLQKKVLFLKNIPENELAALYQLASVSVYISVFEGFGLPVIESMACGCPVITSNVSCLPETAGGAAILCSPGDTEELGYNLEEILNHTPFKEALISKGKIRAREFQAQFYVEKLISLYQKLQVK